MMKISDVEEEEDGIEFQHTTDRYQTSAEKSGMSTQQSKQFQEMSV